MLGVWMKVGPAQEQWRLGTVAAPFDYRESPVKLLDIPSCFGNQAVNDLSFFDAQKKLALQIQLFNHQKAPHVPV